MPNGSPTAINDLTVAEIKEKVKEEVRKVAKGVPPLTLIRSARTQSQRGRIYENDGDLKAALGAFLKAGILTHMFMNSAEVVAESKPGRHGLLYKEFVDFEKTDGNDLTQRVQAIGAKLTDQEKSVATNGNAIAGRGKQVGPSIAGRVKKLNDTGLDVDTSKRASQEFPVAPSILPAITLRSPEPVRTHKLLPTPVIPESDIIVPELLRDYLYAPGLKTLVVDIRTREEFDAEHVKADAIVCLEPNILARPSVTAASLEESLLVAPREEWILFQNRDKFDLVVLYDTASGTYDATGPLSAFVKAVFSDAYRKFLRQTPVLLEGGFQTWKQMFPGEVTRGTPGATRGYGALLKKSQRNKAAINCSQKSNEKLEQRLDAAERQKVDLERRLQEAFNTILVEKERHGLERRRVERRLRVMEKTLELHQENQRHRLNTLLVEMEREDLELQSLMGQQIRAIKKDYELE